MQVSLQCTYAGTTYDLFRGHVERFTTSYDGPNYAETTLECVDLMAALGSATISGTFNEQLTGARVLAVLAAAGWPTTSTPSGWTLGTGALDTTTNLGATVPVNVLDTGRATVAASTFLDADKKIGVEHINEVVDSEPGRVFFDGAGRAVFQDRSHVVPTPDISVLTLTDDPSAADATHVPYRDVVENYEIDPIRNDIQLTAADATLVEGQNTASIDLYGRRTLARTTVLRSSSDSDMTQQVGWYLYLKKDALLRILEVTVDVASATAYPAILGLELGKHVTIVRTPPGATSQTRTQESFIERLTISGEPGPVWRATYQLSPIVPTLTPWTLGTSALDSSTVLVFA